MPNVLTRVARPIYRKTRAALYRYRVPEGPAAHLSSHSLKRVPVKAEGELSSRPAEDLYQIWRTIPGGHKWWHYFRIYESIIGPLRGQPIRLLEVGVYKGGSLAMWRNYLLIAHDEWSPRRPYHALSIFIPFAVHCLSAMNRPVNFAKESFC